MIEKDIRNIKDKDGNTIYHEDAHNIFICDIEYQRKSWYWRDGHICRRVDDRVWINSP